MAAQCDFVGTRSSAEHDFKRARAAEYAETASFLRTHPRLVSSSPTPTRYTLHAATTPLHADDSGSQTVASSLLADRSRDVAFVRFWEQVLP